MLILLISFLTFMNPSNGKIKGKVLEEGSNFPLIGVNISVIGAQTGAVTDINGEFEIENLETGSYVVQFSYLGFKSFKQADVIVKPDRITFLNVKLIEDVYQDDVVQVVASYYQKKEEKPLSTIAFSNEEIRRAPGSGGEISRVLSVMPSVATLGASSQDIIVRGGSPQENGFYIDNIPVPSISHFQGVDGSTAGPTGIVNSELIDNVEFSTGGFNSNYGDKLSSIIDITYREGNNERMDSQLDFNLTGFGASIEGPLSNGKGSYFLSGRRSALDLVLDLIGESSGLPKYSDLQGKLVYNINDKHKLVLLDIYGQSSIDQDLEKVIEEERNQVGFTDAFQNTLGLNWRYTASSNFFTSTSLSYTKHDNNLRLTYTGLDKQHEKGIVGADFKNNYDYTHLRNSSYWQLNKTQKLEFGFDARYENSAFDYLILGRRNLAGDSIPEFNVNTKLDAAKHGVFASFSNSIGKLTTTLGLRADYNSNNENTLLSPRISATYQITDKLAFNASYGIYHQAVPNYFLSQNAANKKLDDIKAVHQIIGFDYLLTPQTKLTIEAYNKEYSDAPSLVEGSSTDPAYLFDQRGGLPTGKLVSNGEAYSRGIEIMMQKKLAKDFYGTISAAYFVSKYTDINGKERNRAFDTRTTFNVVGGYKPNNKWEFSARWLYQGGLPTTDINIAESKRTGTTVYIPSSYNNSRLDAAHSLFVRADRRFIYDASNLTVYLSVWNSYGRENTLTREWNAVTEEVQDVSSFGVLPIIGLEYEF